MRLPYWPNYRGAQSRKVSLPNLRSTRLARGMSQRRLAYKAGQDRCTIANAEKGTPTYLFSALEIALALDVSLSDLTGGDS